MSILAVDVGSSRSKAVLFSPAGEILAQSTRQYSPQFPQPGFAEVSPLIFWDALCATAQSAAARAGQDRVQAVCIASHGETFVPVDRHGRPLGPAILNMDSRATAEAAWFEAQLGRRRIFEITGHIVHPMYPIPKMLWLKRHCPKSFAEVERFLGVTDFLLAGLGLPPYIDYSLASRFLAFDVRHACWSEEMLSAVGLSSERLPIPVPAGTIAGKLTAEAAAQIGVRAGTAVVVGGHDQPCGALGVGVTKPGRVADSMGTYECLLASAARPTLSEAAFSASLNSYRHVVPEQFVTLAYFPSGIMVSWLHDLLYRGGSTSEDDVSELEDYARLEAHAPAEPSGVCVLPHLIGTCNPDFNPKARGTIFGLTPATTREQLYKAVLEGIACELSLMAEILSRAVGDFTDVYGSGGGTRSRLGLRLRAALSGRRFHVMRSQEAVCLGAAILAGVATGTYSSIAEAVSALVREESVVEPDPVLAAGYASQVRQYRSLYPALAPVRDIPAQFAQGGEPQ
ncbi:MAG TPA: FGGY family carbohydrate kinase [Terriglobales bacterium]|nr:FGGY family carbohydrate kinase [Terriglobales bacterium]